MPTLDQGANAFASSNRIPTGCEPAALVAFGLLDRNNNAVLHALDGTPTTAAGVLSTGGGVGYATGAGGAVAQAASKSTGVTLNKAAGQITLHNASLAAGAEVAFTLTNSLIGANDVPVVAIKSGGTSAAYSVGVTAVAAGSCEITVANLTGGALGEALVLNFALVKGAAA